MTVVIQAGHESIQSNCNQSLRSGTGAHDEIIWTPDVVNRVVALLNAHGVSAIHVDANFNCQPGVGNHDYEAAVSVHYQSDPPHQSGYFAGVGDPTQDGAADRSWALCEAIRAQYEAVTHLQPRPNWDSDNITYYYLFEALSPGTPFALIECGTGAPGAPDHDYLWSHKDDVARGIANGVLAFLGKATIPAPEGSPAEEATETPAQEAKEDAPPPPPVPPAEGSPAEEATETPAAEAKEDAPPVPPPDEYVALADDQTVLLKTTDVQAADAAAAAWCQAHLGHGAVVTKNGQPFRTFDPIPVPPQPVPEPPPVPVPPVVPPGHSDQSFTDWIITLADQELVALAEWVREHLLRRQP